MSQTALRQSLPPLASTSSPLGPGTWLQRRARTLVLRQLAGLQHGQLVLNEGDQHWTLGHEPAGDPAASPHAAQLTVRDPRFYTMLALQGSLGAAEAYIRRWWDSADLVGLLRLLLRHAPVASALSRAGIGWRDLLERIRYRLHANTIAGSRRNIHAHYDLGNEFFALFLDPTLSYSCAIFPSPHATLEQASLHKLDVVCRKLDLQPTDHLLEIGAGWGALALHAAMRYGCRVTTTTISRAQHEQARQRIAAAGLQHRITLLQRDYRELTGTYDKLVSIEMIEAVGHENLPTFFGQCARLLTPSGLMLLQGITMNEQNYARYRRRVDFIQRYIFPGSCCPALSALLAAVRDGSDLRVHHLEDIGAHYVPTLETWRQKFAQAAPQLDAMGFDDAFQRTWDYYFAYCAAGFAERYIGDVQLLLARPGNRAPLLSCASIGNLPS